MRDGSWEEEIIAGEEGVGARRGAMAITRESTGERLVEKDQKSEAGVICAQWIGAEGLQGEGKEGFGGWSQICVSCVNHSSPLLPSHCTPSGESTACTKLHWE